MRYFQAPKNRFSISLLLFVWFFIWGVCPWDNNSASAQTLMTAHAGHGHQKTDDTHHTSKGGEHTCSRSALLSKEEASWGKGPLIPLPHNDSTVSIIVTSRFYHPTHRPLHFLEARIFLKRISNLYQLNQSLRL